MKKIVIGFLVFVLLIVSVVFATDVELNDSVEDAYTTISTMELSDKQIIDNDYFYANENLSLDKKAIYGNAFLMGKDVKIKDVDITGSAFVLGEYLELEDVRITGSLYILGEDIQIKNSSFQNIYSLAKDQNIGKGTVLVKNLYSYSKNLEFSGNSNNDVYVSAENVEIGNEAVITGNFEVMSNAKPEIPDSAQIANCNFKLIEDGDDDSLSSKKNQINFKEGVSSVIVYVFITLVISAIILKFCPNFVEKMKEKDLGKMVANAGYGILFAIAIPILSIFLMFSVVGVRLGVILLLLYIVLLMISTPIACFGIAISISKKLNKLDTKNVLLIASGTAVVVRVLEMIPMLSGFVKVILGCVGLGTILILNTSKKKDKESN